jgi:hypothetical protein
MAGSSLLHSSGRPRGIVRRGRAGAIAQLGFMQRDSESFADTGGWGYAQFSYDPASDTYAPDENYVGDAACGHACHTIVEAKDYVFTAYAKR